MLNKIIDLITFMVALVTICYIVYIAVVSLIYPNLDRFG
jgi:hypothetical protein